MFYLSLCAWISVIASSLYVCLCLSFGKESAPVYVCHELSWPIDVCSSLQIVIIISLFWWKNFMLIQQYHCILANAVSNFISGSTGSLHVPCLILPESLIGCWHIPCLISSAGLIGSGHEPCLILPVGLNGFLHIPCLISSVGLTGSGHIPCRVSLEGLSWVLTNTMSDFASGS